VYDNVLVRVYYYVLILCTESRVYYYVLDKYLHSHARYRESPLFTRYISRETNRVSAACISNVLFTRHIAKASYFVS
jgi:hypothetical protein